MPVGQLVGRVIALDVAPVGLDEIAVPLIEVRDAGIAQQLHAEAGRLELVVVQHLHEPGFVLGVLQVVELVLDRRRHPLHRVAEQVQQEEALHLEADVGVDDDAEAVEDAGSRRLEIAVLDDESPLDDRGGDPAPEPDHVRFRQGADQTRADQFVTLQLSHTPPPPAPLPLRQKAGHLCIVLRPPRASEAVRTGLSGGRSKEVSRKRNARRGEGTRDRYPRSGSGRTVAQAVRAARPSRKTRRPTVTLRR